MRVTGCTIHDFAFYSKLIKIIGLLSIKVYQQKTLCSIYSISFFPKNNKCNLEYKLLLYSLFHYKLSQNPYITHPNKQINKQN